MVLVCLQPIPSRSYYYCVESFTLSIWSVGKGESWSLDSIGSDKQLQRWADLVNPFSPCVLCYCGSQNINAMFKSILHLVIRPRYMRIKGPQFLFIISISLYFGPQSHRARCQKKGAVLTILLAWPQSQILLTYFWTNRNTKFDAT